MRQAACATVAASDVKRQSKRWKVIFSAVILLAVTLIAQALYRHSRQAQRLTDKDTIVIADFANSTGDAVFDDTLKTALTVALNQSPVSEYCFPITEWPRR